MMNHFLSIVFLLAVTLSLVLFSFAGELHADEITFKNPVTAANSLVELIIAVLKQIQPFLIMVTALGIMIYGFLYVYYSSQGNESGLKKLHKDAGKLLFGVALVAGAVVIIEAIKQFAEGISK